MSLWCGMCCSWSSDRCAGVGSPFSEMEGTSKELSLTLGAVTATSSELAGEVWNLNTNPTSSKGMCGWALGGGHLIGPRCVRMSSAALSHGSALTNEAVTKGSSIILKSFLNWCCRWTNTQWQTVILCSEWKPQHCRVWSSAPTL